MKNILIKIQRTVPCHKCKDFAEAESECETCHGEGYEFLDDTISIEELITMIVKSAFK